VGGWDGGLIRLGCSPSAVPWLRQQLCEYCGAIDAATKLLLGPAPCDASCVAAYPHCCRPQAQADSSGMLMDEQEGFSLGDLAAEGADLRPAPAAGRHTKRRR
jgi:hypothetical protein